MEPVSSKADVGVIVGRFQVHELHEAHRELIDHVAKRHGKVIIVLGLSKCRVTYSNPLDFESRKHMIQEAYPKALAVYIHDSPSDEVWSERLDRLIGTNTSPHSTVMLYGGRDAFIGHYHGKYPTTELERHASYISGREIRQRLANESKPSREFRAGVIYAAMNQFKKAIPTVDIAIWKDDKRDMLLLARKPEETLFRFVGGYADGSGAYETDARREAHEETQIEITEPEYIGSCPIDDWRYRNEVDGIVTTFFEADVRFGKPTPRDDIEELAWFEFAKLEPFRMVEEHHPLLKMLQCKREKTHE